MGLALAREVEIAGARIGEEEENVRNARADASMGERERERDGYELHRFSYGSPSLISNRERSNNRGGLL